MENITQLTAIGIIFAIAIREFFGYLRTKKNGNNGFNRQILEELRAMNINHLHAIEKAVKDGNDRLIETIHNDNMKIIELLGEIKGKQK